VRLLLDTHAMYWYIEGDPQLRATAQTLIQDALKQDGLLFRCRKPVFQTEVSGSNVSLRPRRACHAGEPVSQARAQGPRIFLGSEDPCRLVRPVNQFRS